MTSYPRRCDELTSHRRLYDVIFTAYARWAPVPVIGVGRGVARGASPPPPNNLRGRGQHTICPPPPPQSSTHLFLQFLCETVKNHKCTKLKGKIIINVTLIWFDKTIPLNSILEFSLLSDFKMKNVIIWH